MPNSRVVDRRYRRAVLGLLALVTASASLVACADGDSGADGPRRGGTLRVATVGLTTLDPAQADDPTEVAVAEMLFTPLVGLDPETHEPRPGLAARWHVDDPQTTFTFTLRRGLTFSDGSALTAADVKATFDRVAAKATNSPIAPLLEPISGYAATHDTDGVPGLSGVVATGRRTLTVTLGEPFAALPSVFANPGLGIIDPSSVATLADEPVGSGPFRYAGRSGATVRLERSGRGPRSARLAGIDLVGFESLADAQTAYGDEEVDLVRLGREGAAPDRPKARVHTSPYLAVGYYAIDLTNPKFADVRFRQAIVQAVDAAGLVEAAYPGGIVSSGLVPEGVPGGGADQCRGVCDHDLEGAKRLIGEAFPGGVVPGVNVDHDDTPAQQTLAATLVGQLTAAGIPAVARPHPEAEYANFLANGDPEVFRLGVVADLASEDAFLSPWFIGGAPENIAHVASTAVDEAVNRARETRNPVRRRKVYADAADALLATFAVAPVVQFETRLVAPSTVRDVTIDPFGGFDARAVWKQLPGGD